MENTRRAEEEPFIFFNFLFSGPPHSVSHSGKMSETGEMESKKRALGPTTFHSNVSGTIFCQIESLQLFDGNLKVTGHHEIRVKWRISDMILPDIMESG